MTSTATEAKERYAHALHSGTVYDVTDPLNPRLVYSGKEKVAHRACEHLNARVTSVVTIISIWSKAPEIGRHNNVSYDLIVFTGEDADETLGNAFMATNRDDRPMGQKACSTSAGDILILDGQHYLVQGHGFRLLTLTESEAIQKLTSRDTSFGFDFMVKHGILKF